jgi:hypothetical protein
VNLLLEEEPGDRGDITESSFLGVVVNGLTVFLSDGGN